MPARRSTGNSVSGGEVISRIFAAPRELVFEVWTKAEHFTRWFVPEGAEFTGCEIDPRPGGVIRFGHRFPDGMTVHMSGTFGEVVENQRLVFTFGFVDESGRPRPHPMFPDWPLDVSSEITVVLEDAGDGTKVTVAQRLMPPDFASHPTAKHFQELAHEGWLQVLARLGAHLSTTRGGPPDMTAKLIYIATQSLDGFIEDEQGRFDWSEPDEEEHRFINDLVRPVGVYLYGKRMYQTMRGWESEYGSKESDPAVMRDFAKLWRAADKLVYSTTLEQVSTPRTRLERTFDVDAIREMKSRAGRDLTIGGPGLAAHAFRAGLVDEIHLFVAPIVLGRGKHSLPDDVRLKLALVHERRFEQTGIVHLHYGAP